MFLQLVIYIVQQKKLYGTSMGLGFNLATIIGMTHDTGFSELGLYKK